MFGKRLQTTSAKIMRDFPILGRRMLASHSPLAERLYLQIHDQVAGTMSYRGKIVRRAFNLALARPALRQLMDGPSGHQVAVLAHELGKPAESLMEKYGSGAVEYLNRFVYHLNDEKLAVKLLEQHGKQLLDLDQRKPDGDFLFHHPFLYRYVHEGLSTQDLRNIRNDGTTAIRVMSEHGPELFRAITNSYNPSLGGGISPFTVVDLDGSRAVKAILDCMSYRAPGDRPYPEIHGQHAVRVIHTLREPALEGIEQYGYPVVEHMMAHDHHFLNQLALHGRVVLDLYNRINRLPHSMILTSDFSKRTDFKDNVRKRAAKDPKIYDRLARLSDTELANRIRELNLDF